MVHWLAFGTYDVERHPRIGAIIEGLRTQGDDVVEVNEPLPLDTAGRVAILRQPWRLPVLAGQLLRCWTVITARAIRQRRTHRPDAIVVGYLGHFDVRLARLLFRRTPIVLDHLASAAGIGRDRALAGSAGLKTRLLQWIDDGALRAADVIVVDTAEQLATLAPEFADKAVVAPVGATEPWFAVGRRADGTRDAGTDRSIPLRAIFVGLFTPLHGTPTLGAALAELAADERIEVTMVGTGQDYAACCELAAGNPRVTWLDWVPGEKLPELVAGHDVSLGIFGTTDKALRVVPTKVYQGAAAGCAILTSDTPPQRYALGDAAEFVPPGDPGALASALRRLADDRPALAKTRTAARELAVDRFTAGAIVRGIRERAQALCGTATERAGHE